MALNDIIFNRGEGGLGRPLAGEDHISGLVAYLTDGNLPSGFGTSDRIKAVFSISEAEALGFAEGSATNGAIWYHINHYFLAQPQGQLYVGLFDSTSIDYSKIEDVQNFADGKIRQIGVFDPATTLAAGTVNTLQTSADNLQTAHKPLSVIYAGDISGVTDLSTLTDLRALSNKNVSVVIGEDGGNDGAALAVSTSASVTALGTVLGAVSLANVNENIAWVGKFNITQGDEYDVPAFANGDLVKNISETLQGALQDKGYIFLRKHVGLAGTYFNDAPTAIAVTSDFAYIENNRTIDKAVRNVRTLLLPQLNGPITVNANGTLNEETIAVFENDARRAIEQMEVNGEVSAFNVTINPAQDVLSTSKVVVSIAIVPRGVARNIEVNIGFTVAVA